jgi:hypothetical protein
MSGNASLDLIFIAGLCNYALRRWDQAAEQFARHPQWKLWYQKAVIMKQQEANLVRLGDFDKIAFSHDVPFTQTETTVSFTFQLGKWLRSEIRVDLGFDSMDVFLTREESYPEVKAFDFEAQINPEESVIQFSQGGLEVVLKKRNPGSWRKLFVDLELPDIPSDGWNEELQSRARGFGQVTVEEAMLKFQEAQDLLGLLSERVNRP